MAVTVTTPSAGQAFVGNQPITVQWSSNDLVDAWAVQLSTNGGASYVTVTVTDLDPFPRTYTFSLPNPAGLVQARVRVVGKNDLGVQIARGDSGVFTIAPVGGTTVDITAPLGGTFPSGSSLTVQWTTTGPVSSHAVRISTNGGASFVNVTPANLPASARSFTFSLPAVSLQTTCIIKVVANNAGGLAIAESNLPVVIAAAPPPPNPTTVQITAPAGGTFTGGSALNVQWTTSGPVSAHSVRLSTNGGASFTDLTPGNLPGAARSFSFTLPTVSMSTPAIVRVVALNAGVAVAQADTSIGIASSTPGPNPTTVQITAPLGGTFASGSALTVQWTTSGPVSTHLVQLSTNGGASFAGVGPGALNDAARSLTFTLPVVSAQATCAVRVVARNSAGVTLASATSPSFTLAASVTPGPTQFGFESGLADDEPQPLAFDRISLRAGETGSVVGRFRRTVNGVRVSDIVDPGTEGLPELAIARFDPTPCRTFQRTEVIVKTSPQLESRVYTFFITGTSRIDGVKATPKPVELIVAPAAVVRLSVIGVRDTVNVGGVATYTVNLDRRAGAEDAEIAFQVNKNLLPPGAVATFDPPATRGNFTTLRIATSPNTTPRVYPVRFNGVSDRVRVVDPPDARLDVRGRAKIRFETLPPADVQIMAGEEARFRIRVEKENVLSAVKAVVRPDGAGTLDDPDLEFGEIELRVPTVPDDQGDRTVKVTVEDPGVDVTPAEALVRIDGPVALALELDGEPTSAQPGDIFVFSVRVMRTNLPDEVEVTAGSSPKARHVSNSTRSRTSPPFGFRPTGSTPQSGYSVFVDARRVKDERVMARQLA